MRGWNFKKNAVEEGNISMKQTDLCLLILSMLCQIFFYSSLTTRKFRCLFVLVCVFLWIFGCVINKQANRKASWKGRDCDCMWGLRAERFYQQTICQPVGLEQKPGCVDQAQLNLSFSIPIHSVRNAVLCWTKSETWQQQKNYRSLCYGDWNILTWYVKISTQIAYLRTDVFWVKTKPHFPLNKLFVLF